MKLNTSILLGILFLLPNLGKLLNNDYSPLTIILISVGLFWILTGVFEVKNYHNKKLYFTLVTAIIVITLILTYIQIVSPTYAGNKIVDSTLVGLFTLIFIWAAYDFTKKWRMFKKEIKWLNNALIFIIIGFIGVFAFLGLMIFLQV